MDKNKVLQKLSDEYIAKSAELSISARLEFLEEYRLTVSESVFDSKTKRIQAAWRSHINVS